MRLCPWSREAWANRSARRKVLSKHSENFYNFVYVALVVNHINFCVM